MESRFPGAGNHPEALGDETRQLPPTGRLAAPRIMAAALASVMLALWGFGVGTVVGWQAAGTLMGLPSDMYFLMFYRMIWFRDVVGMIVKGLLFGIVPATICCFEALRAAGLADGERSGGTASGDATAPPELAAPIVRAACLSMMSILLMNMTWFMLVYHAVPVYGPSLLQPPTP
jgi:phospholipid/cholesterol/gamma-HCH transport system permease protein